CRNVAGWPIARSTCGLGALVLVAPVDALDDGLPKGCVECVGAVGVFEVDGFPDVAGVAVVVGLLGVVSLPVGCFDACFGEHGTDDGRAVGTVGVESLAGPL